MSSSSDKSDSVKQTEYQLGVSKFDSAVLVRSANASKEARGKPQDEGSWRLANDTEETLLTSAANSSKDNREHVTETVAKSYNSK